MGPRSLTPDKDTRIPKFNQREVPVSVFPLVFFQFFLNPNFFQACLLRQTGFPSLTPRLYKNFKRSFATNKIKIYKTPNCVSAVKYGVWSGFISIAFRELPFHMITIANSTSTTKIQIRPTFFSVSNFPCYEYLSDPRGTSNTTLGKTIVESYRHTNS